MLHQRFSAKCIAAVRRLRRRPRGAAGGLPRGRPATATIGTNATGGNGGGGGIGGSNVDAGRRHRSADADHAGRSPYVAVRKVKNLLTGMPPTDADVATRDDDGRGRAADADHRPG